jgi:hypothetical protein
MRSTDGRLRPEQSVRTAQLLRSRNPLSLPRRLCGLELAAKLWIEERELEAGGLTSRSHVCGADFRRLAEDHRKTDQLTSEPAGMFYRRDSRAAGVRPCRIRERRFWLPSSAHTSGERFS